MGTGEEPPARRENGGRRRRWMGDEDDDDEEYVADEEEEEEDLAEELPASSAGEEGEDSDAEYQEEEEEEEEETPRPAKGAARSRKGKMDPATARARRRRYRYEVDDDYEEEPDEDEEVEEYHEEIEEDDDEEEAPPRPKSAAKCASRGPKAKLARSDRQKFEEDDMDFEPELDDEEEEDEELNDDIDFDPEVARPNGRKFEEIEEEEEEEEEEAPTRPKSVEKCDRRGHNAELAHSNRRKFDEDTDFEPELDDEEEEVDEDIDFDPEVDDEDDEFEDEDEEEFAARSRKVTNPVKRKSVSKRRSLKKKKANKGSKASKRKRKTGSAKAKKSAPVRRQRKRFLVDDSDEDSEDDDDFIVEDHVEVNRPPRKKARTGTNKRTELDHPSVVEEETWPNLDSDTSEFEFVTSDEDRDDAGTTVVEASTVRKGKKKRKFGSESSSDSEFIVSDKELENLKETEPPKVLPVLSTPIRKISISTRHREDKGKEKEELEEAGIQICGICLSEEQRATVQGVLNCCSHYFCFACIMEWSRVESRCPLCKQRFTTITKSSKTDLGLGVRKAIIKVEERDQVYQPTEEEIRRWLDPYENVVCIECNQGGDDSLMLLCDICDSSAHTYCVGLGREVPEGNWYCGGCRLGDEGPSHARIPHTVGYERQSYRNHVDFSSVGFGIAAQNGSYDRSASINRRRSLQGIDLNLSPREAPGEIHAAESQVSTDSVSTPTGTRATVSGRRQIHRYIRILLSRPRPPTNRDGTLPNFGQRNGAVPRTEPNQRSFRSSSEANTSQILPDGFQNQYNGLPFAPSMPLDDDFQHIEGVKSNLRNMQ